VLLKKVNRELINIAAMRMRKPVQVQDEDKDEE
jgi:hypothetical protein